MGCDLESKCICSLDWASLNPATKVLPSTLQERFSPAWLQELPAGTHAKSHECTRAVPPPHEGTCGNVINVQVLGSRRMILATQNEPVTRAVGGSFMCPGVQEWHTSSFAGAHVQEWHPVFYCWCTCATAPPAVAHVHQQQLFPRPTPNCPISGAASVRCIVQE